MHHSQWNSRAERPADIPAVRDINLAAFESPEEADLVDALREDGGWIEGLSIVSTDMQDRPVGYALLTRRHIGHVPALCLAPCAVLPEYQRSGAGSAAIRGALMAAKNRGEKYVVVLGYPSYYPRFGFTRASLAGISLSIDVPDAALMALSLNEADTLPSGKVRYATPFGI